MAYPFVDTDEEIEKRRRAYLRFRAWREIFPPPGRGVLSEIIENNEEMVISTGGIVLSEEIEEF